MKNYLLKSSEALPKSQGGVFAARGLDYCRAIFAKKNTIRATLHPTLYTSPRATRYAATLLLLLCLGVGNAWGTDFDITLDQFRTTPISGLVKIDNSNLSLSGGALQLSSGNQNFTVSTTNSNYKIKEIVFTTSKAVISYGGDAISENTFTPASPGTSFTLNLAASGGTAKITQMVVTLTTSTSETLEALVVTAIADGVYTTGSSVITLSTEGGTCNTTSGQEYINLAKSKGTRSLTIATSSSYNIKFIALAFYDAIFSRTISASTGTYTAASYLWTPGATPTNSVTLTFGTENSEGAKIRRVIVGYESAAGGGCTSHSVNLSSSGSVTGGTFATSSATVCEEETATLTATPAAGYVFTSWSASGTGSSLSSTTTNPTTLTMGTADVSVNAKFTKVYASGTYTFYGNTTVGSSPSKTVTTTATDYDAFRIDNLFFSSTNIQYESGSGSTESNDYYGWKVKKSSTIKFFVEDDSDVKICIGTIGGGTCTVSYTDHSSVAHNNTSISSGSHETYEVKGGTMVTLSMAPSSSKSVTLKQIMITPSVSCTAPNHVDITPTTEDGNYGWRYTTGETLKLTATPYSSAGTGSPITSGITGYQWQKYVGSEWTNLVDGGSISGATTANLQISGLTTSNGGSYRCTISTGATCSTSSDGYFVRIFTLYGGYSGGDYSHQPIVWTGEKRGTVTINLNASSSYKFKFTDNNGRWFGNGGTIAKDFATEDDGTWGFGTSAGDATLSTGGYGGGNYVLTVDITHFDDGGSQYVNLRSVVYPKKTTYLQLCSDWKAATAKYAIYYWKGDDNGWTDFMETHDCDGDIRYAGIPVWATNCSFVRFNPSDETPGWNGDGHVWNQTGDLSLSSSNDYYHTVSKGGDNKYYGSWGTFSTPTFTISYAAGSTTYTGGNSISGSKSNQSKTCGVDFTLPGSAIFTTTGYTQDGWATSDGGSKDYNLGGSYTTNAAATFYPHWSINTYTLTASATVINEMTEDSKTGAITGSFTNNPISSVPYGTSTSTSTNTFTANGTTVTAAATIAGTEAQCDECTYRFDSWENIPATVTADVNTIHAKYNTTYGISYTLSGGSWADAYSAPAYYVYGTGATLPTGSNITKEHYSFDGWTLSGSTPDLVNGWGNVTLDANWSANTHDVDFSFTDAAYSSGDEEGTDAATYGEDFEVVVAASSGYALPATITVTIGGETATSGTAYTWNQGTGTVTIDGDYITGDIVITITSVQTYTVTYNLNGGKYNGSSDAPTQAAVVSGTSITLPSLTPTKSGYVFASWKCSVDNTYHWESYSYTMTAANTTFTAQWVAAADLTSGTLYMVDDIKPLSVNAALSSTGQYAKGISSNGCFTSIGNPLRTDNSDGTFEFKTNDKQTVDAIDFTKNMWFKGASAVTSNVPTSRGLKFSVANPGTLTVYCTRGDRIKLSNGSSSAALTDNTSGKIIKREVEIAAAGTYYLYATDNSAGLAGIKFVEETCDDPSASLDNGAYTIGGSALDLRTLWSSSNTTNGVTFSVTNANGTGATIAGDGYSFSATTAGTATISASQTSTGDYCDAAETATITVSNPTYTVTYATTGSTGGSAPTDSDSPYESGSTVTVKGNTGSLVKTGYVFLGWSDGNSNNYAPGETFTISANTTLSPIWKEGTSATVTYTMAVGDKAWSASGSSNETTGIPNAGVTITTTNAGISGNGTGSRTSKLAIKTGANGATYDSPTNYILYNFSVASGYAFTPSDITIQIANVGSSSANNIKYKAVLSDASSHSISTTYICTTGNGTVETFHLYNEEGVTFDGSVSLKLWAWTIADKSDGGSAYRLGTPLTIAGVTESTATLYDISTSATSGTIAVTVGGESASSAEASATVTITATPSSGYSFSSWTVTDEDEGSVTVTSSTTNPTTFTMPAKAVTVSATFSEITHTVTVSGGDHGTASTSSVSGVGIATASGNITATPASGYGFSSWTLPDGVTAAGGFSSSSNPIQINATADGKTITATYTATEYTITYTLHDGGAGSVSGNTTYTIEDDDYDLPTPTWSGHVFQGWYDNSSYTGDRIYVLEGGSTGNKTFHAKWGTEVPVAWTITKIDSKLYKGGGGHTVTAIVDNASWTGSASSLVLGASDGVILGEQTTGVYDEGTYDGKAYVTATFDITEDVEGDAITFYLTAPANGSYGAIEASHDEDLDACPSGGGSTTLFSQNFNSATAMAYTKNTTFAYTTANPYTNLVGSGTNLFTSLSMDDGSSSGITINSSSGQNKVDATGFIQLYKSNSSDGYWSIMRTANFAVSAPTALKVELDLWFKNNNSGANAPGIYMAIGDGFSDGLTNTIPATTDVHSGFCILDNSTPEITTYSSTSTKLYTTGVTQSEWLSMVWIINNTGSSLTYDNPTGSGTTTLADDKFDIWIKTQAGLASTYTKIVSAASATTTTKTLQNIYIGSNSAKSHEFRLDNVVIKSISAASSDGVDTELEWDTDPSSDAAWDTDHLAKEVGNADFTFTASADNNTLGAITYSSSNTSVATVNATTGKVHIVGTGDATITATLAESGCYNGNTATYDITVTSSCSDVAGTVTTENLGCEGIRLTVSGYTAGATIAWYKDGYAITPAATGTTYTATAAGTYYAVTTGSCALASNSITIENADEDIDPIIFADEFTVKVNRSAEYRLMQLEEGETIDKENITNTLSWVRGSDFSVDGPDENGVVSIRVMLTSALKVGDGTITLPIKNTCGTTVNKTITIHAKAADAKPQIAWIATGTKGDISSVLADQSTNTALYEALEATGRFDLTPRNCYWTVSEADLIKEYSKYDLVILTDYPNSQTGPNGNGRSKSYTNALGLLIDRVPMLTFEAFVSGCPNWGFESNPKNTKSTQNSLTLLCNANDIFGTSDTYNAGADIKVGDDIASGQALQGFALDAMPNYVFIAKITDSDDNEYVTCCERQENMNARMMVFGLNANVMDNITEAGKNMVIGFVDYLLKDENASIPDCSVIFNGTTDTDWSTTTNWEGNSLPSPYASVRIDRPCVVADGDVAKAGYVKIHVGNTYTGSLTISPQATMIVQNQIYRVVDNDYTDYLPTEAGNLVVQANSSHTGALIFNNNNGCTNATVEMYSPSYWETIAGKKTSYWSYVGVPIQVANVGEYFYGAVTYLYDETSGWIRKKIGSQFHDFEGIGLAMQSGHKETFAGTLASTQTKKITLTKTAGVGEGENMIGNSWTAPIQIANFDASDFGDATATVMIYQTGRDDNEGNPTYVTATAENDGSVSAGQWLAIPINVPSLDGYDGLKVIPAMQAFQVNTSSRTTLTLDYDKLVRGVETDLNTPMRAPARTATSAQREVESVMRVRVSGNTTRSDVWLLQAEQFSDAFDNGWEASYVECDNRSPQFYAQSPLGKMAFIAKQDLEGTVLGFAPSRDGDTYLITFHYVGDEEFYLNDIKLQQSVLIDEENSYTFTYEEGDSNRFYIGRTPFEAPSVTTGTVNLETETPQAIKVIYNDKLYIIRGGRVYSADGQLVK